MLSWPHYFVVPDVGMEITMDLFTKTATSTGGGLCKCMLVLNL